MAKVTEKKKVETKAKDTKVKETKTREKKEIEIIDSIIDKEEVEIAEEVTEEVVPKKTYRELRSELRSKKNDIEVEILNLNSGGTVCVDRGGRTLFHLNQYGDREFVLLADIYEVAGKYKGFFEKHLIAIIDVDSDDYTVEDIIEYLNLNEIYNDIENFDTDYIMQILSLDIKNFNRVIEDANEDLVRAIAARAIDLFNKGKFDSRAKEMSIAKRIGNEDLFDIVK